jgi:hypothetical protein
MQRKVKVKFFLASVKTLTDPEILTETLSQSHSAWLIPAFSKPPVALAIIPKAASVYT